MNEENFDDEEENFDDDELKENEVIKLESTNKGGRPRKLPVSNNMEEDVRREVKKPAQQIAKDRYVAFKQPEAMGIIDRKTNQPVADDIWACLAIIISKLNRLEEGLL